MRIIDCFYFSGEPIAKIRIDFLREHVDQFIIFESPISFNGLNQATFGQSLQEKCADLAERMTVITIPDMVFDSACLDGMDMMRLADTMHNERKMMDYIQETLHGMIDDEDLVHFSMVDEVPFPELFQFMRLNHSKLDYPVAILGDHFYGSVCAHNALTDQFCNRSLLLKKESLGIDLSLFEQQQPTYPKITLFKTEDQSIRALNKNMILNLDKTKHENVDSIKPLMVKCEDFTDMPFFYRKMLTHCRVVDAKLNQAPHYNKFILDKIQFKKYLHADFDKFKLNLRYMSHHTKVFNTQLHEYILENIPSELYHFGYRIAEEKIAMSPDHLLMGDYHAIYDPLSSRFC